VDLKDAVTTMIDAFEEQRLEYMLAGSFSSNFYGIPRSTKDADFVIQLGPHDLSAIRRRLQGVFEFDPQTTFESVTGTQCTQVIIPDSGFKLELFKLSNDPHDLTRFQRRRREKFLGREIFLPTAEDVIVTKLRWSEHLRRSKDKDDIRDVISVQFPTLDWPYIELWAVSHGTQKLLDEIRQSVATD
jgi:hypothetical protein